jgi:hypothetical protein
MRGIEMAAKVVCFIKRTKEGYENLFEILSWFKPDFSRDFGMKCVFFSMFGSVIPWMWWGNEICGNKWTPAFVMIALTISIFIIPLVMHPLYRAFGICYCGLDAQRGDA